MNNTGEDQYPSPPPSNQSSPPTATDSFRQLDLAYQRVRQLRRDILQTYLPRLQESSAMSPGHEALLLGGESRYIEANSPLDRIRPSYPTDTMERLRQFEAQQVEGELSRPWFSRRSSRQSEEGSSQSPHHQSVASPIQRPRPSTLHIPPSPISPRSPPQQHLLPARTLDPPYSSSRWSSLPDDPHTSLGMRVNASMRNPGTRPLSLDPGMIENHIQSVHRELDNIVTTSRNQLSELSHSLHSEMESRMMLRAGLRRPRNLRADSRQNSGSRLSTLSSFSLQNLPTPTSTISPLVLFDEPTSYEPRSAYETTIDERMDSIIHEERARLANTRSNVSDARRISAGLQTLRTDLDYHQRRVIRYPEDVVPHSDVIRLNADAEPITLTESEHQASDHWTRWIDQDVHDLDPHPEPEHQIVILPNGREEVWPLADLLPTNEDSAVIGKRSPFRPDPLPLPLPSDTSSLNEIVVSTDTFLIAR